MLATKQICFVTQDMEKVLKKSYNYIFRQWLLPGYSELYSIRCGSSTLHHNPHCSAVNSGVGQALLPGSALLILWLYFQVQTDQTRPGGSQSLTLDLFPRWVHIYKQASGHGYSVIGITFQNLQYCIDELSFRVLFNNPFIF